MSYLGRVTNKPSDIRVFDVTSSTSATHLLSWTAPTEQSLIVTINGVKQHEDAYSIAGTPTTVTLSSALVATDKLEVVGINDVGTTITPAQGSVNTSQLANDAVATAKIQDDAVTADKLANSINTEIAANTAKVTNATHTGDVTGATALTIATDAVDIAMLSATGTASASTFLRGDNAWGSAGVISQLLAPSSPADGALWHDTTAMALKFYDGTIWWTLHSLADGSTSAKAITSDTPITSLLTARDESDGAITAGIYWFKNGNGGTYTFPTLVSNYDGKTWVLIQKNFHPHAYKSGDSISSSDHALSYGLMDASNNAVITTNLTNTTPTSSTLGVNHSLVHIDSFADATFTKMLVLDNIGPHWHRFNSISDLDAKVRLGSAQDDSSWEDNTTYSADARQSGATTSYFVFNTRFTAGDTDFGRMGLTDNSANDHDVHNSADEYEGVSSFNDSGSGAYLSGNDDTALAGTEGYLSIWVAE